MARLETERPVNMKQVNVLIVEDNPGDVLLLQEAMAETGFACRVSVARDGIEAIEYLRQSRLAQHSDRPELIVLDLNLPRMNGRDVLAFIKTDQELAGIPVLILTSSRADRDIVQLYGLPQDAYLIKPASFTGYLEVAQLIENFCEKHL